MVGGKKPLPTILKIRNNTLKSDDKPKMELEPKPRPGKFKPPKDVYLDKIAVEEWNRITDELDFMGLLYAADRNQIAAYCMQYSIWSRAVQELAAAKSLTITHQPKNKDGETKRYAHPMITVIRNSSELMVRIATEFGMTPSSRVRVNAGKGKPDGKGKDKNNFFDD